MAKMEVEMVAIKITKDPGMACFYQDSGTDMFYAKNSIVWEPIEEIDKTVGFEYGDLTYLPPKTILLDVAKKRYRKPNEVVYQNWLRPCEVIVDGIWVTGKNDCNAFFVKNSKIWLSINCVDIAAKSGYVLPLNIGNFENQVYSLGNINGCLREYKYGVLFYTTLIDDLIPPYGL